VRDDARAIAPVGLVMADVVRVLRAASAVIACYVRAASVVIASLTVPASEMSPEPSPSICLKRLYLWEGGVRRDGDGDGLARLP